MKQWIAADSARLRAAFAIASFALTPVCFALSFGGERVTSFLGQPLRMTIPLLGTAGDSLDAQCFRVVTPSRSDGLTVITQARVELQTSSTPPLLIIRGSRSLDEPVVRVAIEAGCDTSIRREYTVLLDPPPLRQENAAGPAAQPSVTPPVGATAQATGSESAQPVTVAVGAPPAATSRRTRRAANDGATGAAVRADTKRSNEKTVPRKSASEPPSSAAARDELRLQNPASSSAMPIADASLAALAVPRLKISSDLAAFDPGATPPPAVGGDELQAAIAKDRRARLFATPIEEDIAPRLEADLVVAKRRLAELQAQLTAAGATSATAAASGVTASPAPAKAGAAALTVDTHWRAWLWIPGLLLIAGLVAFLIRQRRSQRQQTFAEADPPTVVSTSAADDEFDTVLPTRSAARSFNGPPTLSGQITSMPEVTPDIGVASPPPVVRATAEREASERLNNPLFQLSDTAPHLDVTELSHITDEAQVYSDLGHNDQAIELLRAHIDEQLDTDRSSPAPWLMIFDLYRRTNNRAGYDELAPRFRKNFNGRMPDWDNYGHELALDDGIEAFPHLVARIERDWGTPSARQFLDELLYDNRGGSRLGFSLAAYRDILLLMQVHDAMAPMSGAAAHSDWESRGADDNDGTPKWDLALEMIEPPKQGELDAFLSRPPPDNT